MGQRLPEILKSHPCGMKELQQPEKYNKNFELFYAGPTLGSAGAEYVCNGCTICV